MFIHIHTYTDAFSYTNYNDVLQWWNQEQKDSIKALLYSSEVSVFKVKATSNFYDLLVDKYCTFYSTVFI